MRSTEVTVNKNDGSYNKHMHVLLCVENAYFRKKENYITQEEWVNLWQRAITKQGGIYNECNSKQYITKKDFSSIFKYFNHTLNGLGF